MLFEYLFKTIVNQNIATLIINEIQTITTAITRLWSGKHNNHTYQLEVQQSGTGLDPCRHRQDSDNGPQPLPAGQIADETRFFTSPARNRSVITSPRPRYKFFQQAPKRK